MSQPIVPLATPKSRRFEKKKQNDMLLKVRRGKLELSVFESLNQEMMETIIDKVLTYDHQTQ